jgi:hypothetical protein
MCTHDAHYLALILPLLPDNVTPHIITLLGKILLANNESRVKQELCGLLPSPHIFQGFEGEVYLVEDVLHSVYVEIAVCESLIRTLITVETSKEDVALFPVLLPLTGTL